LTPKKWISQLKSGQKMSRKEQGYYSDALKWQVVQDVVQGRLTKEEARRAYGIKAKSAVLYWIREYSGNKDCRNDHKLGSLPLTEEMKDKASLEKRIALLEEELRQANERAALWQTMVVVAEEQLKIDIKKKSGAQPSQNSSKPTKGQK
jgi:transposase-like protein